MIRLCNILGEGPEWKVLQQYEGDFHGSLNSRTSSPFLNDTPPDHRKKRLNPRQETGLVSAIETVVLNYKWPDSK
jgi:hypothetical protein